MAGLLDGLTRHQRAAYERARVVPDDSFLYQPQGPGLLQGPELKPRNWLADRARERGMYGMADRLNDRSSGAGLAADAAGGLLNMLVVEPYQAMNRMLERPMVSGDPRNAEDAFNAAGAAMLGGLAAPKPRRATIESKVDPMDQMIADSMARNAQKNSAILSLLDNASTGPQKLKGYSGSESSDHFAHGFTRGPWASPNAEVANTYAATNNGRMGNVAPMEFRFQNPAVVDAKQNLWRDVPVADSINATTNEIAIHARNAGYDGIVFKNVRDNLSFGGDPTDVYHALRRGTVYSPLTGELLYANGGRPGAAMGAGINALAERPKGITAYHGSPHDFDRFDMSKIGTGEGAQAYGHGLYFAENEGVARSYRDNLSRSPSTYRNATFETSTSKFSDDTNDPAQIAAIFLHNKFGDRAEAAKHAANVARITGTDISKKAAQLLASDAPVEQVLKGPNMDVGKMYEVRINADPNDFLDWDKPLSQQSEKVRGALPPAPEDVTGMQLVNQLEQMVRAQQPRSMADASFTKFNQDKSSAKELITNRLREAGIPGIKYLDQGSRTAGEGSRNYVVFDDSLVEIMRKYGLAGLLASGGAVNNLLAGYGYPQPAQPQQRPDWTRNVRPGDI